MTGAGERSAGSAPIGLGAFSAYRQGRTAVSGGYHWKHAVGASNAPGVPGVCSLERHLPARLFPRRSRPDPPQAGTSSYAMRPTAHGSGAPDLGGAFRIAALGSPTACQNTASELGQSQKVTPARRPMRPDRRVSRVLFGVSSL